MLLTKYGTKNKMTYEDVKKRTRSKTILLTSPGLAVDGRNVMWSEYFFLEAVAKVLKELQ